MRLFYVWMRVFFLQEEEKKMSRRASPKWKSLSFIEFYMKSSWWRFYNILSLSRLVVVRTAPALLCGLEERSSSTSERDFLKYLNAAPSSRSYLNVKKMKRTQINFFFCFFSVGDFASGGDLLCRTDEEEKLVRFRLWILISRLDDCCWVIANKHREKFLQLGCWRDCGLDWKLMKIIEQSAEL